MANELTQQKNGEHSVIRNPGIVSDYRIAWVDFAKILACILVVLGHFFQSMVKNGILTDSAGYELFNTVIYYFHNPLLFLCSGYLYQRRYREGEGAKERIRYKLNRVYNLMIPYLFFATLTWGEKKIMTGYTNTPTNGYLDTIMSANISPYWFLMALALMYLLVPPVKERKRYKIIIYIIITMLINGFFNSYIVWFPLIKFIEFVPFFIIGMLMQSVHNFKGHLLRYLGLLTIALFGIVFGKIYVDGTILSSVSFSLLAMMGSTGVVLLSMNYFQNYANTRLWKQLAEYTFPVFMMHTLAAAPIRIGLNALKISQAWLHILLGLSASFVLPVVAYLIMKKLKWPLFILYPSKVVKVGK